MKLKITFLSSFIISRLQDTQIILEIVSLAFSHSLLRPIFSSFQIHIKNLGC